ncbi:hypothetical protein LP416_27715 [Polaromonas sp. P2-4]|nr:hypothetical protein LP416_27715 [Polaromonas sp. P2-4]
MSQGHRTLKERMLERLMVATGWQTGAALAAGLSTSQVAIDDALADLVMEQTVEFKPVVGYRLSGTVLCRQALRLLKRRNAQRSVEGQVFGDVFRLGVAEIREVVGLVMFELEVPMPPEGPEHLLQHQQQINLILEFSTRGMTDE